LRIAQIPVNTLTKSLVVSVGLVVLVNSVLFFPYQNDQGDREAVAQNDDQLFKDCRSKILELGNKLSEAGDRAPYEDVRTEVNAIMTELLVVQSDCETVKERLAQDPAIQYQNEYFTERAKEFQ
jgi:hypothetical protein